ncbi:hypothetical protein [Haloarchaeobius sp. DFWS5]|uniref:hypothetical protein n=1 Tax=Haloarchaeobius sp. DFWS5 TaxID=3446114 RepID=UPI003EBDB468
MTKVLTGDWRVLGIHRGGRSLLLKPLDGQEIPDEFRLGAATRVGRANYGGDVQRTIDELVPGNRITAGVYPGEPGRFTTVDLVDDQRLVVADSVTATPRFVQDLWAEADSSYDGDGPLALTRSLDVPDTVAEVYVAASTAVSDDDLWWAFVGGEVDESLFEGFDHAEGRPAEFLAANPDGTPYFWVVKFGDRDTDAALSLARGTGIVEPNQDIEDAVQAALAEHGFADAVRLN